MDEPAEAAVTSTGRAKHLLWAETLFGAAIMALLAALFAVLYAAFIFSGPLLDYVKSSYRVFLLGGAILMAVTCLYSQFRGIYAILQDEAVVILSVVAASIAQSFHDRSEGLEGIYPTILAAIAVSTVFTGGLFYLLGVFRFGKIIRYVPFSVTAGFMITIGWLLIHGGLGIGLGIELDPGSLLLLGDSHYFLLFVVTIGFAISVEAASRRMREVFALPVVLTLGMTLFHLIVWAGSFEYSSLAASGWLLPESGAAKDTFNALWSEADHIEWGLVGAEWRSYLSVALVSALALLLAVTGLELSTQQQVDVDVELRAAGLANALSGCVGGAAGYHDIGVSTMMYQADAADTRSVLIAAGLCLGLVLVGTNWLAYLPVPFLGGVFLWLGWQLWREWLFNHGDYLQTEDWIAVAAIVVVTVYFGFISGVLLGVGVGISLFLIDYSQVRTVQYVVNGRETRSNVDRSKEKEQFLYNEGRRITMAKLQGYLFFARSHQLVMRLLPTLTEERDDRKTYVVIDFQGVSGIDSTAVMGFLQLHQMAEQSGGELVFSGLADELQGDMARSRLSSNFIRYFETQNEALAYCEDMLITELMDAESADSPVQRFLEELSSPEDLPTTDWRLIEDYLDSREVAAGERLIEAGEYADCVYIVESGVLSVTTESVAGKPFVLRVLEAGSVFGEMALYLDGVRTATVVASTSSRVSRLPVAELRRMEREHPELAMGVHKYLARLISTKLRQTNTLLGRYS